MSGKFIPNGDEAFKTMSHGFAINIANDPARVGVSQAESDELSAVVTRYADAFTACAFGDTAGSRIAKIVKKEARVEAEKIIRRLANRIRYSDGIDAGIKSLLKLRERPTKATQQTVPNAPPKLTFVRALHEGNGASPMHELKFLAMNSFSKARPAGAARVELFVDLVPPDEEIPARPGSNHSGRPWYLRSFTKNPIVLAPPMAKVPMRVVYWARWADSTGNVGPFSATCVGWIEGGTHRGLPGGQNLHLGRRDQPAPIMETDTERAGRESHYSVAVRDAQYEYFNQADVAALPVPEPEENEAPRLEGPASADAA